MNLLKEKNKKKKNKKKRKNIKPRKAHLYNRYVKSLKIFYFNKLLLSL